MVQQQKQSLVISLQAGIKELKRLPRMQFLIRQLRRHI